MLNLPVRWYEGMFLRPQHFQSADRFWSETSVLSGRLDHPFNYGLYRIRLSEDALANGQVEISDAVFRMEDGTVWSLELGQSPDRVPLESALAAQSSVDVFLAIPKLDLGRANVVSPRTPGVIARYEEAEVTVQEETAGGDPQPIELRRPAFRILLSTQDRAGFELLPIARVRRATAGEGMAELDESYVPPLLNTAAWPDLDRSIVRPIYDRLSAKLSVLAERVRVRGSQLLGQDPGDGERLMALHALNQYQASLQSLAFTPGIHPFQVYLELCRIIGGLSIFLPERTAGEYRAYDHNDLGGLFRWARLEIERRLNSIGDVNYKRREFVGTPNGMQVTIDAEWLHHDWTWFIGVSSPDLADDKLISIMTSEKFKWKLGSAATVEQIYQLSAPGLMLDPLRRTPPIVPATGYVYFSVAKEGPAWQAVLNEQTLAMRFNIQAIANRDSLVGSKIIQLDLGHNTRKTVQFDLFAVPRSQS